MQRSQVDESEVESGEEDTLEAAQDFPVDNDAAVEFGWEDKRPLTGRRLKAAKDKQKKAKSGSFGECPCRLLICLNTNEHSSSCAFIFCACNQVCRVNSDLS